MEASGLQKSPQLLTLGSFSTCSNLESVSLFSAIVSGSSKSSSEAKDTFLEARDAVEFEIPLILPFPFPINASSLWAPRNRFKKKKLRNDRLHKD